MLYQHDCKNCIFIKSIDNTDIYICYNCIGGPSIITRFSSDGPDYSSMPVKMFRELYQKNGIYTYYIQDNVIEHIPFRDYVKNSEAMKHWVEILFQKVIKNSNKPFKSGNKINTIKNKCINPFSGKEAYSFYEDDSIVDSYQLKIINEIQNPQSDS